MVIPVDRGFVQAGWVAERQEESSVFAIGRATLRRTDELPADL